MLTSSRVWVVIWLLLCAALTGSRTISPPASPGPPAADSGDLTAEGKMTAFADEIRDWQKIHHERVPARALRDPEGLHAYFEDTDTVNQMQFRLHQLADKQAQKIPLSEAERTEVGHLQESALQWKQWSQEMRDEMENTKTDTGYDRINMRTNQKDGDAATKEMPEPGEEIKVQLNKSEKYWNGIKLREDRTNPKPEFLYGDELSAEIQKYHPRMHNELADGSLQMMKDHFSGLEQVFGSGTHAERLEADQWQTESRSKLGPVLAHRRAQMAYLNRDEPKSDEFMMSWLGVKAHNEIDAKRVQQMVHIRKSVADRFERQGLQAQDVASFRHVNDQVGAFAHLKARGRIEAVADSGDSSAYERRRAYDKGVEPYPIRNQRDDVRLKLASYSDVLNNIHANLLETEGKQKKPNELPGTESGLATTLGQMKLDHKTLAEMEAERASTVKQLQESHQSVMDSLRVLRDKEPEQPLSKKQEKAIRAHVANQEGQLVRSHKALEKLLKLPVSEQNSAKTRKLMATHLELYTTALDSTQALAEKQRANAEQTALDTRRGEASRAKKERDAAAKAEQEQEMDRNKRDEEANKSQREAEASAKLQREAHAQSSMGQADPNGAKGRKKKKKKKKKKQGPNDNSSSIDKRKRRASIESDGVGSMTGKNLGYESMESSPSIPAGRRSAQSSADADRVRRREELKAGLRLKIPQRWDKDQIPYEERMFLPGGPDHPVTPYSDHWLDPTPRLSNSPIPSWPSPHESPSPFSKHRLASSTDSDGGSSEASVRSSSSVEFVASTVRSPQYVHVAVPRQAIPIVAPKARLGQNSHAETTDSAGGPGSNLSQADLSSQQQHDPGHWNVSPVEQSSSTPLSPQRLTNSEQSLHIGPSRGENFHAPSQDWDRYSSPSGLTHDPRQAIGPSHYRVDPDPYAHFHYSARPPPSMPHPQAQYFHPYQRPAPAAFFPAQPIRTYPPWQYYSPQGSARRELGHPNPPNAEPYQFEHNSGGCRPRRGPGSLRKRDLAGGCSLPISQENSTKLTVATKTGGVAAKPEPVSPVLTPTTKSTPTIAPAYTAAAVRPSPQKSPGPSGATRSGQAKAVR